LIVTDDGYLPADGHSSTSFPQVHAIPRGFSPINDARTRRGVVPSQFERQIMLEKVNKQKLVVIGNGMAGIRAVETLLERTPDLYGITVFGSEPQYQ